MPYPSIEDVFNITRIEINDAFAGATGTDGEGRIFIDSWSPVITHLNEAIAQFKRDLENSNVTTNREEVFYTSIPPINSASGSGVGNPSTYQYLAFNGFYDGNSLLGSPTLPADLIVPLKLQSRLSGTGLTYSLVSPASDGLPSLYQDYTLGQWEWRQDRIYWNGSLTQQDIQLRYTGDISTFPTSLDPTTFSTTQIPYLDAAQPLGLLCAYIFVRNKQGVLPTGQSVAVELLNRYKGVVGQICNRSTKAKQATNYERVPFGDDGNLFGWFG